MKQLFKILMAAVMLGTLLTLSSCSFGRKSRSENMDDSKYYKVEVRSSLNIREKPSAKSRKLGSVPNGTIVKIEEIEGDWARVNVNGYLVYVSASHLVPCDRKGNPREEKEEIVKVTQTVNTEADVKESRKARQEDKTEIIAEEVVEDVAGGRTSDGGYREVYAEVRDSAGLFNHAQAVQIMKAIEAANLNITVVTVPEVAPDKFFSFADDLHRQIEEQRSDYVKLGWFTKAGHYLADAFYYELFKRNPKYNKERYTMVYDAKSGLLSVAGTGATGKLMEVVNQKENFAAQSLARDNAYAGILSMIQEYGKGKIKYCEEYGWFKKGHVQTASLFDYLSDEFLVQNMLPNDSFWHRYIIGPLCKYPLKFATGLVGMFGSLIFAMVVLGIIYLSLIFGVQYYHNNMLRLRRPEWERLTVVWGAILIKAFMYLTLVSMLIYAIPAMEKIIAMEVGGYSASSITSLLNQFNKADIVRSWPLVSFFIIGLLMTALGDPELLSLSTLGSRAQQLIHGRIKQNSASYGFTIGKWGWDKPTDELDTSATPFSTIFHATMPDNVGKKLGSGIPVAFIINPGFMLIAGVRMWISGASFIIKVINNRRLYRSNGLVAMG